MLAEAAPREAPESCSSRSFVEAPGASLVSVIACEVQEQLPMIRLM